MWPQLADVCALCAVLWQNLVGRGEVDGEVEGETAEECRKFGRVLRSSLVVAPPDRGVRDDEAVRVFVEFEDVEGAARAVQALHGRLFAARRVACTLYDMGKFRRGELL